MVTGLESLIVMLDKEKQEALSKEKTGKIFDPFLNLEIKSSGDMFEEQNFTEKELEIV